MKPYNVEIFGRAFNLIAHTTVDASAISIDYDYLTPNESSIQVRLTGFYNAFLADQTPIGPITLGEVEDGEISAQGIAEQIEGGDWEIYMNELGIGCYIRITRDDEEYFGVVTSFNVGDDPLLTKIGFKPFIAAVFDTDILFSTNLQGTQALETVIRNIIYADFETNVADELMNVPYLETHVPTTSTVTWGMNLKSDVEGMEKCIINFYDVLIRRALSEYGIVITTSVNVEQKKIYLDFGTVSATKTIEIDLPNVYDKTLLINEADKNVNVLQVFDSTNYASYRMYYKHTDGTYDMLNGDRIYPPVRDLGAAEADDDHTFAENADSVASSVFGEVTYNNLIEVTCHYDDELIQPSSLKVGTVVKIINDGIAYTSILTGYKLSNNVITLIFGSIRADLTKMIRGNK